MEEEIWKVYYESKLPKTHKQYVIYEVSNCGNVKRNGVEYIPKINKYGYKSMPGFKWVHRAVAELFIPNPENKSQVDHIDCNPSNNNYLNLVWSTPKENSNNPNTINHYRQSQYGNKNACGNHNISKTNREKMRSNLGKHRVYDNKKLNIYHYE